ncbi:drebrin-like protein B [Periplaneta americana]|uniref:drebrin-like protein B n=1 Tax=Periplaneta americana TaxID=6978 RepID=UPI0037E84E42
MAINLMKYKDSLQAAWKDVVDDKSLTDWALFGYEGQTNDLKVVSKGAGGIEEMTEDLNSGKIMYAFCKVIDPKTSLPKCVLINWQGEGAPLVRKGTCANHLRDVANFFKGAHVTLNARNEEEVDTQLIIEKVAKSTGSAYSFKERGDQGNEMGPVGTTYKRVIPRQEINSKERDKFWEKEEQEEKQRQAEERKRKEEEQKKLENERKQRELREAALREERIKERTKSISQLREAERNAEERMKESQKGDEIEDREKEEEERRTRSDVLRRQRSQEAQAVISKRTIDARAVFEQNTSAGQMHHPRRSSLITNSYQSSSMEQSPPPSTLTSRKASLPVWPPASSTETSQQVINSWEERNTSENQMRISSTPSETEKSNEVKIEKQIEETPPIVAVDNHNQIAVATEEDKSWERNDVDRNYLQPAEEEDDVTGYSNGDLGLQARALYDYQAADATEITFDPGDIITHIDQIDEGWWQGLGPDGTFGLFPANYVELLN